ncbi:hypothetical protein ACSSWA_00305 [Melioribacter sp. Ez-97]|uniref:hypothetical protein n=1 Tax=Melioribacter sp. Ez-97 TaxID=3423434 RepID=UPI003EDB67CB
MKVLLYGYDAAKIVDEFVENWSEIVIKSEKVFVGMRSSDAPSFLQIIGQLIDWTLPLKAAATAFLVQLSKEAAKDLWKNKSNILKCLSTKNSKKIDRVSELIANSIRDAGSNLNFILSLEIPEKYIEANFSLKSFDKESIAFYLSHYVDKLESIYNAIIKEANGDHPPLQLIEILISEEGKITIKWMDAEKLELHERKIN